MSNELPYLHMSASESQQTDEKIAHHVVPVGHQVDNSQPALPTYFRSIANPAPLGLLSFACTSYVLSLINVGARGVTSDAPIIGLALAFGGTTQFMAGMWEFAAGNTFGATAFSAYGAFWWSFALTLLLPAAFPALAVEPEEMANYLGFYLSAWFIFTVIILLASLRSSICLASLFTCLSLTFGLLFSAFLTQSPAVKTAGGAMGLFTSAIALYTGAAGLLAGETSLFTLPVGPLAKSD